MYVTRPLSLLRKSPELVALRPSEGPNSGYLVLYDEECETTTCFGLCKDNSLRDLPFPQNKNLSIIFTTGYATAVGVGDDLFPGIKATTVVNDVLFLPVLDEPLSSNRYYVIHSYGKYSGKVTASSKEEDKATCCCCKVIKDVKPQPFDASDIYQQVEIVPWKKDNLYFTAKSVASDGNPPDFLRIKHWTVQMRSSRHYHLEEAPGLDPALRARLPDLDSLSVSTVGKWYCPFTLLKEGGVEVKDQMRMSTFYEVTLEQRWDKIFGCENGGRKAVEVNVVVEREEVFVGGTKSGVWEEGSGDSWFRASCEGVEGVELSSKVMERLKWEEERGGWVDGGGKQVRVERREEFQGSSSGGWSKFGCYVLVERFVFKRMDKTIALAYDFIHTHQIRCKWE